MMETTKYDNQWDKSKSSAAKIANTADKIRLKTISSHPDFKVNCKMVSLYGLSFRTENKK